MSFRIASTFGGALAALLIMAGCQSYEIVQQNVFSDDNGNVVAVEYGRSESQHVNTFVSPVTGQKMEFKSKLVVRAVLPNGESFKAWQCMNFLPYGTMYRSDSEEWMLLANGFSCTIFHQTEDDPPDYLEVYRGVLCETPTVDLEKNDKWKPVNQNLKDRHRRVPAKK